MVYYYKDYNVIFYVSFGMNWIDWLFGIGYDEEIVKEWFDRKIMLLLGMDFDDLCLVIVCKVWNLLFRLGMKWDVVVK